MNMAQSGIDAIAKLTGGSHRGKRLSTVSSEVNNVAKKAKVTLWACLRDYRLGRRMSNVHRRLIATILTCRGA